MLLWAESFDHYNVSDNLGRTGLLQGAWSSLDGSGTSVPRISNTYARTGSYALEITSHTGEANAQRPLGVASQSVGVAFALYQVNLPSVTDHLGLSIRDSENNPLLAICVRPDGTIAVKAGSASTGALVGVSDPVVTAGAFDHIEVLADFLGTESLVEVYVNGVLAVDVEGENLGTTAASLLRFGYIRSVATTTTSVAFDDIVAYTQDGVGVSDRVGPVRVLTMFPESDGPQQDWSVVGASPAYEAINEASPDDDTTYLASDTLGDVSSFGMGELPSTVEVVEGIYIPARARLAEAGSGELGITVRNGTEDADVISRPLTTAYTYRGYAFDRNPDTGQRWLKSEFEEMLLKLEKTL